MAMVKYEMKNNVRKYRVWKGWKQKDLAKLTGISVSQIRLIEQQKCTPRAKNANILCEVIGVIYDQLFYKDELDLKKLIVL